MLLEEGTCRRVRVVHLRRVMWHVTEDAAVGSCYACQYEIQLKVPSRLLSVRSNQRGLAVRSTDLIPLRLSRNSTHYILARS